MSSFSHTQETALIFLWIG